MKVRELLIHWGFEINDKPLRDMEQHIESAKAALQKTAIIIAGVSAAVGYAIKKAGDFEQWQIQFETLMGSAEQAKKFLEDLEMFGLKASFDFPSLARTSKLLIGMGVSADKVIPTLKMLGDVAVGSNMDIEQLTEAYLKIRNMSGSLEGRQARMIIGKIPQFVAALNQLYGTQAKTFEELENLKGSIPFEDITKAFQTLSAEGGAFGNLMAKLDNSALGALGDLKDWIGIIAKDVGQKLLPRVKQITEHILSLVSANRKLITMRLERMAEILLKYIDMTIRILKSFAQSFGWVIDLFGGFENALKFATIAMTAFLALNLATALGSIIIAIAKTTSMIVAMGWAALWANLKIALFPTLIGAAFIALGLIIEDIIAFFQGRKSITGLIVAMAKDSSTPLGKLWKFISILIAPSLLFFNIIKSIWKFIASGELEKAIDSISAQITKFLGPLDMVKTALSLLFAPIILAFDIFKSVFGFIIDTLLPKLVKGFSSTPLETFAKTFQVMINPAYAFFNIIKDIIGLFTGKGMDKVFDAMKKIAGIALKPFEVGINMLNPKNMFDAFMPKKKNQQKQEGIENQFTGKEMGITNREQTPQIEEKKSSGFDFAGITKGIGSFISNAKDSTMMNGFATSNFALPELNVSPMQAVGAMAAPQGKTVIQNVQLDNKIEVKVPPDTPPQVAGEKVKEGVSDALERMLRNTYKLIEDRGDE